MDVTDPVAMALRAIHQPVLAADGHGRVRFANQAFFDHFQLPAGGDADRTWRAFHSEEDLQRWRAGIETGQPFDGSTSGGWTYSASPVYAADARWMVILSKAKADHSLDEQLVRMSLHAALRANRMGLWEWNPQSGNSIWSAELYDVYRLPRGSGLEPGSRFLEMLHPDDRPKVDAAVAAANTSGRIDPYVFRLYAGDGSLRWIMTSAQAAREPGMPFTRLVGVNIDVTETVQAEGLLEVARLERARQEQIMRTVMEHAPVGIAVALAGEDQLAYVSRFGAEMIKATPDFSRQWEAWQICHPETKVEAPPEDLPLLRASAGAVIRDEEWLLKGLDGGLLPISCNAGPIYDTDGAIMGATVVWHDVTPFKQAQRQRELFIAAVSHELRTPLSAIHGWSETLLRTRDPALVERGLKSITRNVESQTRLVDDLLDAARIAAGKLTLTLGQENLSHITRAAVDSVMPVAEAAQIVLDLAGDQEELPVLADEQRMRQAICNLLTNAVKFSRPGGLVAVSLAAGDGFAELQVSDHGIGMDSEQLERVFEQFWQGDAAAGRKGGLGLGMAIARHIIRGHGGTLIVHSDGVGKGAVFKIRMPLRRRD